MALGTTTTQRTQLPQSKSYKSILFGVLFDKELGYKLQETAGHACYIELEIRSGERVHPFYSGGWSLSPMFPRNLNLLGGVPWAIWKTGDFCNIFCFASHSLDVIQAGHNPYGALLYHHRYCAKPTETTRLIKEPP